MNRLLDAGADVVIPKPLRQNQLKGILNYIMQNSSLSDPNFKLVMSGITTDNVSLDRNYAPMVSPTT